MSDLEAKAREMLQSITREQIAFRAGKAHKGDLHVAVHALREAQADALETAAANSVGDSGPFSGFGVWYLSSVRAVLRARDAKLRGTK